MESNNLIILLGPTASGKTKLAVQVANVLDAEIISADSRQVFKGMDLGTGKDLDEYLVDGKAIPYHLINILEAGERYNVSAFKEDFYQDFESIGKRGRLPILCGGTGMYIHSILQNHELTEVPVNGVLRGQLDNLSLDELGSKLSAYPKELISHADVSTRKRLIRAIEVAEYLRYNRLEVVERPPIRPLVFGLKNPVEITRRKILARLESRLQLGLVEEVEQLMRQGISKEMLVFYGLEYKFITYYLTGTLSYTEMKERLGIAICQFAKRQMTFFRKMEKDGVAIHWLDARLPMLELLDQILKRIRS